MNDLKKIVHFFLQIYVFLLRMYIFFLRMYVGLKTRGMPQTHFRGSTNEYLDPNKAKWGPNRP